MHNKKVVNVEPVLTADRSVPHQVRRRQNTNGVRRSYREPAQHYPPKGTVEQSASPPYSTPVILLTSSSSIVSASLYGPV